MCVRRRMTPNNYTIARAMYARLFCIPIPKVSGSNPLGRTNPLKSHQFFVHRPTAHSLLVLRPTPLSASRKPPICPNYDVCPHGAHPVPRAPKTPPKQVPLNER